MYRPELEELIQGDEAVETSTGSVRVGDSLHVRPCVCPERSWGSGGIQNTGGGLQQQGIPIPHPPLIRSHPTTAATVNENERKSFEEGIQRAGQLEATCDNCNDVTDGSPVPGELDPQFPQIRSNSNGTGARHNADQCFVCHAQPQLGSGGFIVPNPADPVPQQAENPQFRLVPHRFGRQNVVPALKSSMGRFARCASGTSPTELGTAESINSGPCAGAPMIPRFPTAR